MAQIRSASGQRLVAVSNGEGARQLVGVRTTYDLAIAAIAAGSSLEACICNFGLGETIDLRAALDEGRVLAPVDHPDPAHLHLSGTGLTHLGSADARDRMHSAASAAEGATDSMRMFRLGLEGGRPEPGRPGVQPEWFYKGDGDSVVAPEGALESPAFGLDGGEEPEIAGVYVIGADATPYRLGYALANEFSDHVTERQNYLYLAHSKLRAAAFGPELLVGELPHDVRGRSRILRGEAVAWEAAFLSGEANMSHTLANLEHHHFKYDLFRRPGDVHVHFFGTASLSFADGFRTEPGDIFEIEAEGFGAPLRNTLAVAASSQVRVCAL